MEGREDEADFLGEKNYKCLYSWNVDGHFVKCVCVCSRAQIAPCMSGEPPSLLTLGLASAPTHLTYQSRPHIHGLETNHPSRPLRQIITHEEEVTEAAEPSCAIPEVSRHAGHYTRENSRQRQFDTAAPPPQRQISQRRSSTDLSTSEIKHVRLWVMRLDLVRRFVMIRPSMAGCLSTVGGGWAWDAETLLLVSKLW